MAYRYNRRRFPARPRDNRHIDLLSYNPLFTEDFTEFPGGGRGRGRGRGKKPDPHGFGSSIPQQPMMQPRLLNPVRPPQPVPPPKSGGISLFDTPGPWTNESASSNASAPRPLFPASSDKDPNIYASKGPTTTSIPTPKAEKPAWATEQFPEDRRLNPEAVLRKLPPDMREMIHTAGYTGNLDQMDAGKLRLYIMGMMERQQNPFPVVKAFKDALGDEHSEKFLTKQLSWCLDSYYETGRLPTGPPPIIPSYMDKSPRMDRASKPPIEYSINEIPGVRLQDTGERYCTKETVRWIRTAAYGYAVSGEIEKVEPFVAKMRQYFGQFAIDRAMNETQKLRIQNAAYKADSQEDIADDPESQAKAQKMTDLKQLMHHLTYSQVPGVTGQEDVNGLSTASVSWIRCRIMDISKVGMNPDAFVKRIGDMFGPEGLQRIFGHPQFVKELLTSISKLPADVGEPVLCNRSITDFGYKAPASAAFGHYGGLDPEDLPTSAAPPELVALERPPEMPPMKFSWEEQEEKPALPERPELAWSDDTLDFNDQAPPSKPEPANTQSYGLLGHQPSEEPKPNPYEFQPPRPPRGYGMVRYPLPRLRPPPPPRPMYHEFGYPYPRPMYPRPRLPPPQLRMPPSEPYYEARRGQGGYPLGERGPRRPPMLKRGRSGYAVGGFRPHDEYGSPKRGRAGQGGYPMKTD